MGPGPEGALNLAAWEMIREIVSSDPALTAAAWESLRAIDGILPANGNNGNARKRLEVTWNFDLCNLLSSSPRIPHFEIS